MFQEGNITACAYPTLKCFKPQLAERLPKKILIYFPEYQFETLQTREGASSSDARPRRLLVSGVICRRQDKVGRKVMKKAADCQMPQKGQIDFGRV